MYFGLSPIAIRKLAFDFSLKLNLKVPKTWTDKNQAEIDWFSAFLKKTQHCLGQKQQAYQEL